MSWHPRVREVIDALGHRDGTLKIDDARLQQLVNGFLQSADVEMCTQLVLVALGLRHKAKTAFSQVTLLVAAAMEATPADAWLEVPKEIKEQARKILPAPRASSLQVSVRGR